MPCEHDDIMAGDEETIITGSLDRNRQAHRIVPGETCLITFLDLDQATWKLL